MNDNQNQSGLTTILLCLGLLLLWSNPGLLDAIRPPQPNPTPIVQAKAIRATFVFEKSAGVPPAEVMEALRNLVDSGVASSAVDQDVTNGDGNTPKQYEIAIREGKKFGIPCLVVEFDDGTFTVAKATTADDVKKAVMR